MKPAAHKKKAPKPLTFAYALRSFVGHLEGTSKAAHTIKNYRLDLQAFQDFLGEDLELSQLTARDLERYHDHLKGQSFKTNTRRRKLMTVRKFLAYLRNRNKLSIDLSQTVLTPHKLERVPYVAPLEELVAAIRKLPADTETHARNRVLFWVLAETGCQVSEACQLRFDQLKPGEGGRATLEFLGKNARVISVSGELFEASRELQSYCGERPWMFMGYNQFGPLGGPITSRGVELLVKVYAERLGFESLTPRTFRHSAIVGWMKEGMPQHEVQKRLGLRSAYAFKLYAPILSAGEPASRSTT